MVLKKKHQKSNSSNVGVGKDDKISKLPDELIHLILSFLPIKCAMSTCILSKRWEYLSNSIPYLDFSQWRVDHVTREERNLKTQQFMNFMDTVLYIHEKPNIQKFCLKWNNDKDNFDESRITKWIRILVKRKVEQLFLSGRSVILFPLSFFTCDSLTVLKLNWVRLNVPNTVSFPRLKLLSLGYMEILNGISIEKLLSNCPILEGLSLLHCFCFKTEVLCIESLALKNLDIKFCSFPQSTVKICANNLSSISYGHEVPADFVINNFPSLVEANVLIHGSYPAKTINKLFEKLTNVKLLKMSGSSFMALREADILSTNLSAFDNLIHLEICPGFYFRSFDSDCASAVRVFFRILQLSPNLESIVFAKAIIHCTEEEDLDCWSVDPKCSLLCLKSITFKDFEGKPWELEAIRLFLRYAGVLETITVVASPCLSGNFEAQTKAMRELLMFPRPNGVVKFLLSSENI